MVRCSLCQAESGLISEGLGVCLECIRKRPRDALVLAGKAHAASRTDFGLPESAPKAPGGAACNLCVNQCRIPEGGIGYCGLRKNTGGRISGISSQAGKLSWYHDPLPTNCVASWACAGGTGAGYPDFAHRAGAETGFKNLAVFFHACSFNCLYCQNWQFRRETASLKTVSPMRLAADVNDRTSCICYFGGDPAPQLPFSLQASRLARAGAEGRILRICWETNGSMHERLLDQKLEMARVSGGCVKFDLKAFDDNLHIALTGITNRRTLSNFKRAGDQIKQRPVPPLLVASTLMVPGYIDADEIGRIATFIASINPQIPYSLLAFYPHFYMADLPLTSKILAYRCFQAARQAGLKHVRLGNVHLLA